MIDPHVQFVWITRNAKYRFDLQYIDLSCMLGGIWYRCFQIERRDDVNWWSSYGAFDSDVRGLYPLAGQVVTHYRTLAGLSREQVAARLGIGPKALYYAEHEGRGLDSISRLRQVGMLLHIPLALLGLCSAPVRTGWWYGEYEAFPAGSDGWPNAACVVQCHRRMKQWTQRDLADALSIQELSVRKMENKGVGLDSLMRRRALRFLLSIPPLLLGLDGIYGVPSFSRAHASALPTINDLRSAQERLWVGYYTGDGQNQLSSVNSSLLLLKDALPLIPTAQRSAYLEHVSLLYQAAGNVVLASAQMPVVLSYMNTGIEYARASENSALLSTALGRRAAALFELGDFPVAEKSIREALSVLSQSKQVLRYPVASRVLSCLALDRTDRAEVLKMLDKIVVNDDYNKGDDPNVLLWCRAQVLINLAQNAPDRSRLLRQASELLDRAELTAPDTLRRKLIIKLEQARAYTGLRELEYATDAAIEAFQLMRQIKSVLYIPQLSDIYHTLLQSSYAGSPQTARLGLLLFQVGVE